MHHIKETMNRKDETKSFIKTIYHIVHTRKTVSDARNNVLHT